MADKKLIFAISMLNGGGAENVLLNLIATFRTMGVEPSLIVTSQSHQNARMDARLENVPILFVEDCINKTKHIGWEMRLTSLECHFFERTNRQVPDKLAERSFMLQYKKHVDVVRNYLKEQEPCPIVAFLLPTAQIILKAVESLPFPVILSERSDPKRYLCTRYANVFFHRYYNSVRAIVFQTPYALECYPTEVQSKGVVIPNPIKENLPIPYTGTRKKIVVNYCRLTPEKNLKLLIDAFVDFYSIHKDYRLEIYGDGPCRKELITYIQEQKAEGVIEILPYASEIHEKIRSYAMFVSSSDWEGLSNSMLEAMAIGLPTICTDCDGGGARFVIKDGKTGLLVPKKQVEAMSAAMSMVADSEKLSNDLSLGGRTIREQFKMSIITQQWYNVIFNGV